MRNSFVLLISVNLCILSSVVSAQTDETFKIFQFPAETRQGCEVELIGTDCFVPLEAGLAMTVAGRIDCCGDTVMASMCGGNWGGLLRRGVYPVKRGSY